MDRSRLGSFFVFVFIVVAFTVAAPSIGQLTHVHVSDGRVYDPAPRSVEGNVEQVTRTNTSNETIKPQSKKSGAGSSNSDFPLLETVAGVLLLVLVGVSALVFYRSRGTRIDPGRFVVPEESAKTEDIQPEPDLEAVGAAAGRAAEHIENDDTQNAVYRAWREMTILLGLSDSETTTPGEFADEALDIGMNPDDVARLTEVFEEVRYGDAPVTPDRQQQAREALRRIESRYKNEENERNDEP